MAPTDRLTHQMQLLSTLVTRQRVALGYPSKEKAAEACGLSHMTYRAVEAGRPVSDLTYTKIEAGFGLLPGSCQAVLDGADSVKLQDGGELIAEARSSRPSVEAVDAEAKAAIQIAIGITTPDMTMGTAQQLSERALEELRKRGLLPR